MAQPAGLAELADAIRAGTISAEQAVEECTARIEALNPSLNAVVARNPEAVAEARTADAELAAGRIRGPLHGVPVTIKDSFAVAGLAATAGHPALRDFIPERDATVVRRLREAGAIILGKTNLPRLAADWQTDNPLFGRARNPWAPERSPGGSSGGSAVAVATGMSPLDVGSDLGGSIRVPAHFCGVFGLKPTEHRVSRAGVIPDDGIPGRRLPGIRYQSVYGPLARCVADLALAFRIIAGPDADDPAVPPVPVGDTVVREGPLRLRFSREFAGVSPNAASTGVLDAFLERLRAGGLAIEEDAVDPALVVEAWSGWGRLVGAELGPELPRWQRLGLRLRQRWSRDSSPLEQGLAAGRALTHKTLLAVLRDKQRTTAWVDARLGDCDGWLCPVSLTPAITPRRIGNPIEVDGRRTSYTTALAAFVAPFSLSGHPVVVLPAGCTDAGLPVGIQLVGRRWREDLLLGIAARLEAVAGGFRALPGAE